MRSKVFRSRCPIASSLDILGDKWTLIVIRDLFRGKFKFSELAASPEKIKTNILTDRLKWLEENKIVQKSAYQAKPTRYMYVLTDKGKDLMPIMQAMASWGERHIGGTVKVTHRLQGSKSAEESHPASDKGSQAQTANPE